MDIWEELKNEIAPEHIHNNLIRVVESQEQIATNNIVNELDEQFLLEQMIEDTKPKYFVNTGKLHYLLTTPFRYPPLKHGSRFGTKFEPSLFYASHKLSTAFAETSYYRLLFWQGMSIEPSSGKFTTQHTIFKTKYSTTKGLKLHEEPFSMYEKQLIDLENYLVSQKLGTSMREYGIKAFEYKSARDNNHGINVALFTPEALLTKQPEYQQHWICDTSSNNVSFFSSKDKKIYRYEKKSFLVNGKLPNPAI